jgi:hypothetical protein
MTSLLRLARVASAGLVSVSLLLLTPAPAAAACVPSEARVTPASAEPGQAVIVSSNNWFGICNDTGQQVDVTDRAVVTFVQGDGRVVLGQTNSNAEGVFSLEVRVPDRAAAGPAVLEVRGRAATDDVPLTVTEASLARTGVSGAASAPLLALLVVGASIALCRRSLVKP